MFEELKPRAPDPLLDTIRQFRADPRPNKLDLGVGVFQDEQGRTPVLGSVKKAEGILLETQQTCDITFRMYDYGRPRELHVEKALEVMRTETAAGKVAAREMGGFTRLIEQKYFTVDRYDVAAGDSATMDGGIPASMVGLHGAGEVEWNGGDPVELRVGQAVVVPVSVEQVVVRSRDRGVSFVRCFAPML